MTKLFFKVDIVILILYVYQFNNTALKWHTECQMIALLSKIEACYFMCVFIVFN